MPDYRSEEARRYRKLYSRAAWRARRLEQLTREPLCQYCQRMGRVTGATVADHIEPHRGDETRFWHGELQSLCKFCHDSVKAFEEINGYHSMTDRDGYPIDPRHPANKVSSMRRNS